jgi:hypothetical protein
VVDYQHPGPLNVVESGILAQFATRTLRLALRKWPTRFDEVLDNQAFVTENCRLADHANPTDHTGSKADFAIDVEAYCRR